MLLILLVATSSPGVYVAGSHARATSKNFDGFQRSLGFISRDDPRVLRKDAKFVRTPAVAWRDLVDCYSPESPKFLTMSSSPFNHHVETGLPLEQDVSLQQYMDAEKEKKRHRKKHGSSKSSKRHHHHKDVSSRVSEGTQKASNQSGDNHLPKHDTNKESSFAGNVPWLSPNEEMQSRRPSVMTKPLYANTSECEDLGQRNLNTTVDTTMESETLPYTSTA